LSTTHHDVLEVIFRAIDEANKLATPESQLVKQSSTVLLGEGGVLDSLGLITLIVAIEERLQSDLDVQAIVLDEEALADPEGPYRTIETLANWILTRIG
jgi:D-alanine--poly(phosphoribitol) ligase subunit 2